MMHQGTDSSPRTRITRTLAQARWALLRKRLAESAGIGLAAGCVAGGAILMAGIIDAGGIGGASSPEKLAACAGGMALAGAVVGACWGWISRPTISLVAQVIDQRLGCNDLAATALWIIESGKQKGSCGAGGGNGASADDANAQAMYGGVLAMAAHRLSALRPADVVTSRLGRRAWSAVAICVAMLAMGMGWVNLPQTQAVGSTDVLAMRIQGDALPRMDRANQDQGDLNSRGAGSGASEDIAVSSDQTASDIPGGTNLRHGSPSSAVRSHMPLSDAAQPLGSAGGSSSAGRPADEKHFPAENNSLSPRLNRPVETSIAKNADATNPPKVPSPVNVPGGGDDKTEPWKGGGIAPVQKELGSYPSAQNSGSIASNESAKPEDFDRLSTPAATGDSTAGQKDPSTTAKPRDVATSTTTRPAATGAELPSMDDVPAEYRDFVRDYFSDRP